MSQHSPGRSNWSITWFNFFWVLGTTSFRHLQWFSPINVPTSMPLQHLKDVGFIQVLVLTSLRHVNLVSLTQVSVGTLLRRLKLVGFIYAPMRRRKDVTNRSVSFTYQLRRHDDVSEMSATSRPILGTNEAFLRCFMPDGKLLTALIQKKKKFGSKQRKIITTQKS